MLLFIIRYLCLIFNLLFRLISSMSSLLNLTSSPNISNAAQNLNDLYSPFLWNSFMVSFKARHTDFSSKILLKKTVINSFVNMSLIFHRVTRTELAPAPRKDRAIPKTPSEDICPFPVSQQERTTSRAVSLHFKISLYVRT